jgi:2-succinyl-6-hydroxy-2,4-cyclohexadiene-1-carboxylate synthase
MTRRASNGVRYEVRPAGGGPPLLLVHGFTGRGSSWAAHLPALRRTRRTIVVDLLGHGRSDAPLEPARHAVECQADDLATLLRELDAAPAAVVGYSMGARIALRLAIESPELVERLVLESPSAGIADPATRERRRRADAELAVRIERDGMAAFADAWATEPIFASQAALPERVRARIRRERLANRPAGLAASLRGAGQGSMIPLHDRLGEIRCPTLVVAGQLDPRGRERAEAIAAGIPGAGLFIEPGAGHRIHLERPAAFRRAVLDFLAAVDPPSQEHRSPR